MALINSLTRGLVRGLTRGLLRTTATGPGAGVDNLLVDDNGDHYLIDDSNTDVRQIED